MQKTGERRLRKAEYRTVLSCQHIPLGNNQASKLPVFVFFVSSSSPAVVQERRGLLCTKLLESSRAVFFYRTVSLFNIKVLVFHGDRATLMKHQLKYGSFGRKWP